MLIAAGSALGAVACPLPALARQLGKTDPDRLFAAARRGTDGQFSAAIFRPDGADVRSVALPARAHDLTSCPVTRRCVVFARRPGNFAIAFSRDATEAPVMFTTPEDRHFFGHGVFSRDGRLLYATENDFDAGQGKIGIYDAGAGFRRIGELPSHGIEPHDMTLLKREHILVVANGGILTHPDIGEGRGPLNLDNMEASLAYIDLRTGDLIERQQLGTSLKQLSLRHLDVGRDDTVVIGCQYVGPRFERPSLVFRHRLGGTLTALELPDTTTGLLRNYVSSIAVDRDGEIAAVTSSRGSRAVLVEIASGRVLQTPALADISGVAPSERAGEFMLTSGEGKIERFAADQRTPLQVAGTHWQWDNHAIRV